MTGKIITKFVLQWCTVVSPL